MPAPEILLSYKVQRKPACREDEELIVLIQRWHWGSQTHSPFPFTLSPLGSALCTQSVYITLKSKPVPGFGLKKKKKDCPLPEAGWSLALQTELAVCRLWSEGFFPSLLAMEKTLKEKQGAVGEEYFSLADKVMSLGIICCLEHGVESRPHHLLALTGPPLRDAGPLRTLRRRLLQEPPGLA